MEPIDLTPEEQTTANEIADRVIRDMERKASEPNEEPGDLPPAA